MNLTAQEKNRILATFSAEVFHLRQKTTNLMAAEYFPIDESISLLTDLGLEQMNILRETVKIIGTYIVSEQNAWDAFWTALSDFTSLVELCAQLELQVVHEDLGHRPVKRRLCHPGESN